MVIKQIQDLLHSHDCVIIPDFGGLIAQYASSKIHPVKHTFTPPSKKLAFNEKLKHNDGLLVGNLAEHLQIQTEDARQMVAQFVGDLQADLARDKRCELQGIGIFRYNAEQKLEFEYLEAENFLAHSFGLPELEARPIVAQESAMLRTVRQKAVEQSEKVRTGSRARRTRSYVAATGTILAGGLTVALVYVLSLQTNHNLSSLNPVSLFSAKTEMQANPEKTVAISEEKVTPASLAAFDELPVTPEEESVKAIEADQLASVAEVATPEPEIRKEVLPAIKPVRPENGTEIASKTTGNLPAEKTGIKKIMEPAAEPHVVKAETKPKTKKVEKSALKEISEMEKLASTLTTSNTIKSASGRYFIISGGFSSLENARRSQIDLAASGANSEVIMPMPGSKLHRVTVAEFENMETASAKLPELRQKFGNSLWILQY